MELKDLYELFLAGGGAGVLICRTKIVAPETKHWLVCLGFIFWSLEKAATQHCRQICKG